MSVPAQEPITQHTGNGVTTSFAYQFLLTLAADLGVTVNGVDRFINSDYALTGLGNPAGGTITFAVAPPDGAAILFVRAVALKRETSYQYSGDFNAKTVNADFDRLWMAKQDLFALTNRSIKLPPSDGNASVVLPKASVRAKKALVFDAAGGVTVSNDNYNDQLFNVTGQALIATTAAGEAAASADAAADSEAAALITVPFTSATPPPFPTPNRRWIDLVTGREFVWLGDADGFQWVEMFGSSVDGSSLATELRADLVASNGAALIGGGGQTVPSITGLRTLLKTSPSKQAFVAGYYAPGDGGGGQYAYDAADTTTLDNGASVIVAADGGRWKLASSTAMSIRQAGAKGDRTADDGPALQTVLSRGSGTFPSGEFRHVAGLISDYRTAMPAPGAPSARLSITGHMSGSILNFAGTGFALNLFGADNEGAGQGIHGLDTIKGLTVQDYAFAKSNSGIYIQNKAYWSLEDISVQYMACGLELQSCFTGKVLNSYFNYGDYGAKLTSSGVLGGINAVSFDRCTFTGNRLAAVLGVVTGSVNSFRDCTFESNGTQGDLTTGGLVLNLGTANYSGPLVVDSCYFENNKGGGDILIDNTTTDTLTVMVRGCLFNRASGAGYTVNCINATSSGGGLVNVILQGNKFLSLASYPVSASRAFFNGTPSAVRFIDGGGNTYNETSSLVVPFDVGQTVAGSVNAAGAMLTGPRFVTSSRLSAGIYRITAASGVFGISTLFYTASAVSNDASGTALVRSVIKQTPTTFDVTLVNSSFTPTDGAFSFSVASASGF